MKQIPFVFILVTFLFISINTAPLEDQVHMPIPGYN